MANRTKVETRYVSRGNPFGCGTIIYLGFAAVAGYSSYLLGNNIFWVVVHAAFSWLYLLYLCGGCGGGIPHELYQPARDLQVQEQRATPEEAPGMQLQIQTVEATDTETGFAPIHHDMGDHMGCAHDLG